jgi:hypothetical protein
LLKLAANQQLPRIVEVAGTAAKRENQQPRGEGSAERWPTRANWGAKAHDDCYPQVPGGDLTATPA